MSFLNFSIRDGLRAIKRRLQTQVGKNNTCVLYTLTLLETIVKNGNRHVHQAVCDKEFIQALVVLIGPKYDPPQAVQEKVLGLIQVRPTPTVCLRDFRDYLQVIQQWLIDEVDFNFNPQELIT